MRPASAPLGVRLFSGYAPRGPRCQSCSPDHFPLPGCVHPMSVPLSEANAPLRALRSLAHHLSPAHTSPAPSKSQIGLNPCVHCGLHRPRSCPSEPCTHCRGRLRKEHLCVHVRYWGTGTPEGPRSAAKKENLAGVWSGVDTTPWGPGVQHLQAAGFGALYRVHGHC